MFNEVVQMDTGTTQYIEKVLVTRYSEVPHNGNGKKLLDRSLTIVQLKDLFTDAYGGYMVILYDLSLVLKKLVHVPSTHSSYPPHPDVTKFLNHYDGYMD